MISFSSIEQFYEEARLGVEFELYNKWYLIEFDDPFCGKGKVRIHLQDDLGGNYLDETRMHEYENLEELVHNYKILERTLAEIICDENGISRNCLPIKQKTPPLFDMHYTNELDIVEYEKLLKKELGQSVKEVMERDK